MHERKTYRLAIELTPHFMSDAALRKHISYYRWKEIRLKLLAQRGLTCEVCESSVPKSSQLDAHEAFSYPDNGTAHLDGIQLLCKRCHFIKDFAQTERLIYNGILKAPNLRDVLIDHFCRINECEAAAFDEHYRQACQTVRELELRYGAEIARDRINYGEYHGHFLAAQNPDRFNTHTATHHAIADAIRNGVHEDYRESLLEIARMDQSLAEELLRLIKSGNYVASRALIAEVIAEEFSDDSVILDDEPIWATGY